MRSLLTWSVGTVGHPENESTDHIKGIAPVPLWVKPEPRRPGKDYRSPISAGCQHTHERRQPSNQAHKTI